MDVQNVNLQTALHLAVERQHTQIVRVCVITLFHLSRLLSCVPALHLFDDFYCRLCASM